MRKAWLVLVLVVSTLMPVSPAYGFAPVNVKKLELGLLAVSSSGGGLVIPVWVSVSPGEGRVYVYRNGSYVGEDTVESIRYAARLACLFLGLRFSDYDYMVWFPRDVSVEGVSATLPFTIGFMILLRGDIVLEKTAATGIVSPSGIIGNISGLPAKYEAAVKAGYRRVIAPYYPGLAGKPGYGNYTPVFTIYDAYEAYTGEKLLPVRADGLSGEITLFNELFTDAWREMYGNTSRVISAARKMAEQVENETMRQLIERKLVEAEEKLNRSLAAHNASRDYLAASLAFQAYLAALTAYFAAGYGDPVVMDRYTSWYTGNKTIAEHILGMLNRSDLWSLDAAANIYTRYYQAVAAHSVASGIATGASPGGAVAYGDNAALSLARLATVRDWWRVYMAGPRGPAVSPAKLRYAALSLAALAGETIDYLASMGYPFSLSGARTRISEAESIVDKDPVRAYIIALAALSNVSRIIDVQANMPPVPFLSCLNDTVQRLAGLYLAYMDTLPPSMLAGLSYASGRDIYSAYVLASSMTYAAAHLYAYMLRISYYAPQPLLARPGYWFVVLSMSLIAAAAFFFGYMVGHVRRSVEHALTVIGSRGGSSAPSPPRRREEAVAS